MKLSTTATLVLAAALISCSPSGEKPKSPAQKMCAQVAKHVRKACKKGCEERDCAPGLCKTREREAEEFCEKAHEDSDARTIPIVCEALKEGVIRTCEHKGKKTPAGCKAKGEKKEGKCQRALGL